MADATIRAKLGLENTEWRGTLREAQADLDATKDKAKALAAAVALSEREMAASKGTKEQITRLRELRSELAQTEQAARKTAAQMARIQAETPAVRNDPYLVSRQVVANRNRPAEGGGEGGSRGGVSEIGHSVRSFTDAVGAGASPLTAAQMEAPRLIQGLGGGIGEIAAVAGVAALVSKLHSAFEEARGLETALKAAMVPIGGGGENFQSIDLLRKHIEGIKSSLGNTLEADGTFSHAIGQWVEDHVTAIRKGGFKNMKPADMAVSQERTAVAGAQDEIGRDAAAIADKVEARNRIARRGLTEGKDTMVDPNIDRVRDENLGNIRREGLPSAPRLNKAAEEEARIQHEAAAKERDSEARSIALENQIVDIKRAGLDVDIKSAQARLDAANVALDKGPTGGNEHGQLQEAVKAATQEVEQAKKATAEKRNQYELESQIASLRGSSDQVRQRTLELEGANLATRKKTATADELPGLNAEQARNQQQRDELTRAGHLRAIDRESMEDRAAAGRGPGAQVDLINKELGRTDERRTLNTNENGGDPNVAAQLDEQAAQLKRTKEDILFAEQQTLAASKAQTQEMQLRASGNDAEARVVAIRAQYEAEIAAAIHAGRTDLAEQKRIQEQMALVGPMAQQYREQSNPKLQNERAIQLTREQQAAQNMADDGHTHEAAGNTSTFDSTFGGASFDDSALAPLPGLDDLPIPKMPPLRDSMPTPDFSPTLNSTSVYTGPSADAIGAAVAAAVEKYMMAGDE